MTAPDLIALFPHRWQAEILPARPLVLPARNYVYPLSAEEVERGALEVLVQPRPAISEGAHQSHNPPPFLATCALGFRDAAAPTGIWSTPCPDEICAVSGGYAYIIDTAAPERFTMIPYRPVLEVLPAPDHNLLLFVGHHSILAWGPNGQAWESERLSSEGITLAAMDGGILRGLGWDMATDKETSFALELRSGRSGPTLTS